MALLNDFSETIIGIDVINQWPRLYPWNDL